MKDLSFPLPAPRVAADPARFELHVCDSAAALDVLRADWDALLAQDPASGVFLCHDWLRPALDANPGRWRILALRDGRGRLAALLPLKHRLHWSRSRNRFETEYEAAGRLGWGEYTGIVTPPEDEEQTLPALARCMAALPFARFKLRYEPTGRRARALADAFGEGFAADFPDYRINKGTTDNLVGLHLPLGPDFADLLSTRLSRNTRQKLVRFRRRYLESGAYRITEATPATSEHDIAALLTNWMATWRGTRSDQALAETAETYARALLGAEAMGRLYLPVLHQGDRVLGALGHVVDERQGRLYFLVAGRDPGADDPAIGLLLHAHAIEWAIAQGLSLYDFGHGDQPYKQSFGPDSTRSTYLDLRRVDDGPVLDAVSLPLALRRLDEHARGGKTDRVRAGAAQLAGLFGL